MTLLPDGDIMMFLGGCAVAIWKVVYGLSLKRANAEVISIRKRSIDRDI